MSPPSPPDSFLTLGRTGKAEIKVQRSRFIGVVSPAPDEATARLFITEVARGYHDSRHVCHAWRLGYPPHLEENRNDDGEPSGTAGEPILSALRRQDITNVVGVVVRYFGGVKLGTGGLQRAYGEAARQALAEAPIREVLLGRDFRLCFPYNLQKTLRRLLENYRGRVQKEEYTELVAWQIWLPHSTWQGFASALEETTAGQVSLQDLA